jgi:uncharacterized OB-fold protein
MTIATIRRQFPVEPSRLLPEVTPEGEPFWTALKEGRLVAQRCTHCRRQRWPVAPVCGHCGETGFAWDALPEQATLFSFVRYRRSFLPEFEDLMPYAVVTAKLGPDVRMYGRLLTGGGEPWIGMPLKPVIELWPDDRRVLAFRAAETG